MSTLIAYFFSDGFVFAADRNITVTPAQAPQYQREDEKIFAWPGDQALVGAVGDGYIGTLKTKAFLLDFIARHSTIGDPAAVAHQLRDEIQTARASNPLGGLIVQFAAFAERNGVIVPEYWHITNVHGINAKGDYDNIRADYGCSEELLGNHAKSIPPADLRATLKAKADAFDPMWFHQSVSLPVFNALELGSKVGFAQLYFQGLWTKPASLNDWEKYLTFWVCQYGAYFEAFYPANQQLVGGGATVLSVPWP